MKAKILLILLIVVTSIALAIALSLEILSRIYECETPPRQVLFSCREESRPEELKEKSSTLDDLKNKRLKGEKISKEEYRQAADIFIIEVEPLKLCNYFNGIACRQYIEEGGQSPQKRGWEALSNKGS